MTDERRVLVTIRGNDDSGEMISLSTRGWLQETAKGWLLRYTEMNPGDLSTQETLVFCEDTRVTVTRIGMVPSTMVFSQGETFVGEYATPLGSLRMRIYATKVTIRRHGNEGRIHLEYQISLHGALSSAEEASMRFLDIRFSPGKR